MKHCFTLFLLLSLLGIGSRASAQITITAAEYFSVENNGESGSGLTYDDTSSASYGVMQGLINTSGANQTWDFSTLTYYPVTKNASQHDTTVPYSSNYPYASSFPNATNVIISQQGNLITYAYFQETSNAVYLLGAAQDSAGVPAIVDQYNPPIQEVALPLTYQTSWSSTTQVTAQGQSVPYEQIETVDSYGTLKLPGNVSEQCLRLKETLVYAIPGFADTTYLYAWVTATGYGATITMTPGLTFMGTPITQTTYSTSYTDPTAPSTSVKTFQANPFSERLLSNPASTPTDMIFTMPEASDVRVTMMDLLGRESTTLMNGFAHAGLNAVRIDPTNLENGTYFVRIESNGNSSIQKLIVAH